jgi:hypothetical protein
MYMKKYEVAVMALALALVGVATGQTPEKSQAYDRSMREYQKFVGQFPSPEQTRVDDTKQYTEALVKFEQYTKTFEQALESFQRAERQYQKFLDSFPSK